MKEARVPPLNYIYFYITNGCNLRCRHCWIAPHHISNSHAVKHLDPHLFSAILAEAMTWGLQGVKLTGGEPLVHPSFPDLLASVHRHELALTIETNATLVDSTMARHFRDLPSINVSVSLDGAKAETHDRIRGEPGTFRKTILGIAYLVAAGIHPEIIITLMEWNRHELPALTRLARELGARSVKVNCLQPIARGEHLHYVGGRLPMTEILALSNVVDAELSRPDLPVYVHLPPAFRPLGRLFGDQGDICSNCGILGILGVLADGSYALCGIGATIKEMVFGHASRLSLERVWTGNGVLTELRAGLPHRLTGVCGQCIFKGFCLGGCIAQNYYRHRHLWAPFWFCEEAQEQGLFPTTRLLVPADQ